MHHLIRPSVRWAVHWWPLTILALALGLVAAPRDAHAASVITLFSGCPPDAVKVGPSCIDKYEASVWQTTDAAVIHKIRLGTATLADLTAAGATQLGLSQGDLAAAGCPDTGSGCKDFFALSIPGVKPSRFITWFQATAAARNAGKRLPTNAEWQAAALGTPDPGETPGPQDCNTFSNGPDLTGARANCVSDVGAFDMVGNLWEWVADWVPLSTDCPGWGSFSDDRMCLGALPSPLPPEPGALVRGGSFSHGSLGGKASGVFAVDGSNPPSAFSDVLGFRAAR